MRYHELTEKEDYRKPVNLKKNIALIKRDCQPYLSQVKDPMMLRRGVARKGDRMAFGKKQAHLTGRNPRGVQMKKHHEAVNKYFTSEFGLPFRNGVMASGDQMMVGVFGTDVAVFPIGEFKFLWSPNVRDLNDQIIMKWADEVLHSNLHRRKEESKLIDLISNSGYQTTDLQAAIESKNEVMIWVEEYYTLDNNVDRDLVKKLLK